MPPAAKADPVETVGKVLAAAKEAADPAAKGAALAPLIELFADASALPPIMESASEFLVEAGTTLDLVAAMPPADLTMEIAGAAASAMQLASAFIDTDAAKAAVSACANPLITLVSIPASGKWSESDLTEARASLLSSACAALNAVANHWLGRYTLQTGGATAQLLAMLQRSLASQPALQVQAAIALSRLAEAPLSRATLGAEGTKPGVFALVEQLNTPSPPTDATALRLQAKLVLLLGFCLYDGQLRPGLLDAGLLTTSIALVEPPPADPDAEAPSPEAAQCLAELKSNAATVLAIGGQSDKGRAALIAAGGVDCLVRLLLAATPPVDAGDSPEPPAAASDQALAALLANVTLALAHIALDKAAAVKLATTPNVLAGLTSLLAPVPDGAVGGWAAVRGNACTATMHILDQEASRKVYLTCPAYPVAPPAEAPADVAEGEEGEPAEPPPPPPSALSAVTALISAASPTTDEAGESVAPVEADESLIATAADLLSQMASEYVGREAVVEVGGDAALIALLTFGQPDSLLEPAVSAVAALARHPACCLKLRGPPPPPAEAPTGGEEGEEAAPEEPAEPPAPAAPSPLVIVPTLLASSNKQVVEAAAFLVHSACTDTVNAQTLVRLKVPPTLVELSKADDAQMAKMAVDNLCYAVPSAMLWHMGMLPDDVLITDGFYAVTLNTPLLAVDDLAQSNAGPEVLHVNPPADGALAVMIAEASELVSASTSAGASATDVAASLARFVCDRLGGPIPHEAYQHFEGPEQEIDALRAVSGSRVLPLGSLTLGAARHRAVLFKTLADYTGACAVGLQMGKCVRGAHAHHAWNVMIVDEKECVVDVLHAPGEFYPLASDAARRYQRVGEFAFQSLTSGMAPIQQIPPAA